MENLPQLFIQLAYAATIGHLVNATMLDLLASVVIYFAQKDQNAEGVILRYTSSERDIWSIINIYM